MYIPWCIFIIRPSVVELAGGVTHSMETSQTKPEEATYDDFNEIFIDPLYPICMFSLFM